MCTGGTVGVHSLVLQQAVLAITAEHYYIHHVYLA
jgi:hypothetical protein